MLSLLLILTTSYIVQTSSTESSSLAIYDLPDSAGTGRRVALHNSKSEGNPEELGAYIEGDIRIPFRRRPSRWPGHVVPYEIHGNFTAVELQVIDWAFAEYQKRTCLQFKRRTREKDFISLVNGNTGCWSSVGRLGGKQEVNLQSPACVMTRGTILHELMHVLGFLHEHNRPDRDDYIYVHTENIREDMMNSFEKNPPRKTADMGIGYDYGSVMHYSRKSFSKNGKPTIEAKVDTDESRHMGQRDGFSFKDVAKIRLMYKCQRKS